MRQEMMHKLIKSRAAKIGLPPGTPVHIGERKAEGTRTTVIAYDEGQFEEEQLASLKGYVRSRDRSSRTSLTPINGPSWRTMAIISLSCSNHSSIRTESLRN
jgi:hypothetical protein